MTISENFTLNIDFAGVPSYLRQLESRPNLIVLQTFSKAWGMAGIRLGIEKVSNITYVGGAGPGPGPGPDPDPDPDSPDKNGGIDDLDLIHDTWN